MEYDALLFDLFGTLVDGHGSAVPSARELLASLAPERWAIVTSCYASLARDILARAELPVPDVLITSDLLHANKPSPQGYLLAAKRLGRPPQSCIVFEDSVQGVAAAVAAQMDVVAISAHRDETLLRNTTGLVTRLSAVSVTAVGDGRYRVDWLLR